MRFEGVTSVKTFVSLFVAAAFVAGFVGATAAQTTTTTPAPAEKKMDGEKKTMDKRGEKKMAAKSAAGTVKSAAADSLVVAGKAKGKEAEWTFAVDSKTKIKKGGKNVTAADVQAGDSVSVRYMDHDGKMVAQSVNVRAGMAKGGMAKKEMAKPAEKK
jgi:hypothetical protein